MPRAEDLAQQRDKAVAANVGVPSGTWL